MKRKYCLNECEDHKCDSGNTCMETKHAKNCDDALVVIKENNNET